jgi:phage shock protein C
MTAVTNLRPVLKLLLLVNSPKTLPATPCLKTKKSVVFHTCTNIGLPIMTKSKPHQLYRSNSDRYLAGVCGGIAAYFNLDSTLIRLLFIAIILMGGSGLIIYLILWAIIPSESANNQSIAEATMKKLEDKSDISKKAQNSRSVWGLFLIGIGIVMLLDNFGIGRYLMLDKTWPSIFVILGLIVLSR